jgi:UDP-GlcNAc:undecaprenyl-phosphate GlcNAc-1-phosphate transferase
VALLLVPGGLMFLLGLVDDLFSLPAWIKFAFQALAGAMLYYAGYKVTTLPLLFGMQQFSSLVALVLTILWVMLITNAFNLIDGLDGLAAGSALFATVTIFVVAIESPLYMVSLLTVVMAGAILGFLRFNFNPATVFLGDCGSLFLGFMLSAMALAGNQKSTTAIAVAIPVVSFGLPILDTAISVLRRFISGQPLFRADREHIHHKLLERGFSQKQAVVLLYGVSALFGISSLLLMNFGGKAIALVLVIVGAVVWLAVQHLGYHEFFELKRVAQRTVDQKRVMVNNLAIRRGAESLAVARTLEEVCDILQHCFQDNDFDGFRLVVPFESPMAAQTKLDGLEHDGRELCFSWDKPAGTNGNSHPGESSWRLTLDLVSGSGRRCGGFQVYRWYGTRPLLFDVNLLTTKFPVVLADALDRVLLNPSASKERAGAPAIPEVQDAKAS